MKKYFLLYAKGIAMGAADVVPGVSGGTVAFITGIYDELLASLASFPRALGLLVRGRIAAAWQAANATFLLVLLAGILTSVLSLARLITYLLAEQPIPIWSFFFGLISAYAQPLSDVTKALIETLRESSQALLPGMIIHPPGRHDALMQSIYAG